MFSIVLVTEPGCVAWNFLWGDSYRNEGCQVIDSFLVQWKLLNKALVYSKHAHYRNVCWNSASLQQTCSLQKCLLKHNIIDMAFTNSWVVYKHVCNSSLNRRMFIQRLRAELTGGIPNKRLLIAMQLLQSALQNLRNPKLALSKTAETEQQILTWFAKKLVKGGLNKTTFCTIKTYISHLFTYISTLVFFVLSDCSRKKPCVIFSSQFKCWS